MIQLQFLNYILNTKDNSLITLNNLDKKYFSQYTTEWEYILNHLKEYGNIPDKETFLSVFPNFELIKVEETPSYLISELFKDYQTKQLTITFNEVRKHLLVGDTEKAISSYHGASEKLNAGVALQCVDILKDTSRYDAYIERTQNFDKYYIKTGFPELDSIIGGWDREEELATIIARTNVGKCLEKGTKLLMADGTLKKVEDIKVGDKVQSLNSSNKVLALHNGTSKGYRIIPNNGIPFVVSEKHILTLMKRKQYWDKDKKTSTTKNDFELVDIVIEDYLKLTSSQKRNLLLYKPKIEYNTKNQLIPAYILGIWLGDGTSCRAELTSKDEVIIKEWYKFAESLGLQVTKSKGSLIPSKDRLSYAYSYDITAGKRTHAKNKANELLKYYNLLNSKHIPLDYLTGDYNQRLDLLAGILDTDGYLNKNNIYELVLSNKILISNVSQLARGLGFNVTNINYNDSNNSYGILISGEKLTDIPIKLNYKKIIKSSSNRKFNLTHFKVEPIALIEYYGFMTDGDHRYLLEDNILTHNSWIILKAASAAVEQGLKVGLYSGEMTERKVGYRLDTLIGHIANGSLTHGNNNVQAEYKKHINDLSTKYKGSLYVLTPKMINGPAGVMALRAFIEKYNLDILFVDQHSLLEDDRGAKNPVEKASNISKDLKNLQVMKRIPIVSVSQMNRTKNDSDSDLIDTTQVAQTDRIGQDSSLIIGLSRDKKDKNLLKLQLVKSRDSEAGIIFNYIVNWNLGKFTFIPNETTEEDKKEDYEHRYDKETDKDVF